MMAPQVARVLALFTALLLGCVVGGTAADSGAAWRTGRATHYSAPGDLWTIHDSSCTHKYIWPDIGPGWDAGAMSDQNKEFIGSCGRCYEIRCNPVKFKDGYGAEVDRTNVCYDPSSSVVIQIVDACPCYYPANYYSNQRWCCGDMDHFDISVWAFEKLADLKWGVIALQYRPVPCNYKPAKPAPKPAKPTPGIPPGPNDRRP